MYIYRYPITLHQIRYHIWYLMPYPMSHPMSYPIITFFPCNLIMISMSIFSWLIWSHFSWPLFFCYRQSFAKFLDLFSTGRGCGCQRNLATWNAASIPHQICSTHICLYHFTANKCSPWEPTNHDLYQTFGRVSCHGTDSQDASIALEGPVVSQLVGFKMSCPKIGYHQHLMIDHDWS